MLWGSFTQIRHKTLIQRLDDKGIFYIFSDTPELSSDVKKSGLLMQTAFYQLFSIKAVFKGARNRANLGLVPKFQSAVLFPATPELSFKTPRRKIPSGTVHQSILTVRPLAADL